MEITYVVNSNFSFYQKTLPVLFNSLDKTGSPWKDKFIIVIGESPVNKMEIINGVQHFFVTYGGIDFTGAFFIAENYDMFSEFIFYTHDTVYVGENFFNLIKENFKGKYYKKLSSTYSMNIGIFRKELFKRYYDRIKHLKFTQIDEKTRMEYKHIGGRYEDIISRYVDDDLEIFNDQAIGHGFHNSGKETYIQENVDVYKTNSLRKIFYVPELDFYKVKANIGGKAPADWIITI